MTRNESQPPKLPTSSPCLSVAFSTKLIIPIKAAGILTQFFASITAGIKVPKPSKSQRYYNSKILEWINE